MTFTAQDIAKSLEDDGMAIAAIVQLWRQDRFHKQHELRGNQLAHTAACTDAGFSSLTLKETKEAREIALGHADQLAEMMTQHLGEA